MKHPAGCLTSELREKFHDLLVTQGGIVFDDEFKREVQLDIDLHRQEQAGRAQEYEDREGLLDGTLDRLSKSLRPVNFLGVYEALVKARWQQQEASREQRGIDRRREFIETRKRVLDNFRNAAKDLQSFIEDSPYPTTMLSSKRRSRVTELLTLLSYEIEQDSFLNWDPRDGIDSFEKITGKQTPILLRSRTRGHPQPWLKIAYERLKKSGISRDDSKNLLIAVGLIPLRHAAK